MSDVRVVVLAKNPGDIKLEEVKSGKFTDSVEANDWGLMVCQGLSGKLHGRLLGNGFFWTSPTTGVSYTYRVEK